MSKEKPLVEIRTVALVEGINEFDYTGNIIDYDGRQLADAGFDGEITVHVDAKKSDEEISITISTSAMGTFSCDRCMVPISKMLHGSLELFYTFNTSLAEKENEIGEYRQIATNTEYIDITDDVCDALFLSLPVKVICTDNPDCKLYDSNAVTEEKLDGGDTLPGKMSTWRESLEKLKSNIVN